MGKGDVFICTPEELDALKKKDKKLAEAIDRIGIIKREVNKDIFSALIGSIVSQQISSKAAETVGNKLLTFCGEITPERIHYAELADIQKCGMSMRKAQYIKNAGETVYSGGLDLAALADMPDAEVIKRLSALSGIGVWTAEMLLIFSLERRDVLSFGDLAIHRGLRMLYRNRKITRDLFDKYRRRYSPYATVASLYLWAIAGGAILELRDPASKITATRQSKNAKRRKVI